ncbi:hypothetical protein VE03_10467 [Pseudogymnoascus sp. 23342-1-I1]|nr:hypothetical protein VE03_10467 [Pseudogymnoascus sp. 23342-1-I1]
MLQGIATVAISVTFEVINDGSPKPPPNLQKAGLSVKLHNFCISDEVNYHGPQQQLANSMRVPQRILDRAKGLSGGATVSSGGGMSSVFALNRMSSGNHGLGQHEASVHAACQSGSSGLAFRKMMQKRDRRATTGKQMIQDEIDYLPNFTAMLRCSL